MNDSALAFAFLAFFALYLLPSLVAFLRAVPNRGSVTVINILLGWSLIGWAVSLAMACRSRDTTVVRRS